jgi:hypothetical protein
VRRHFSPVDDARLEEVMEKRMREGWLIDWAEIAQEMDSGFSSRQVKERWLDYLGIGINRAEFTIAERRQCLKESVDFYGDWAHIASRLGNGTERTGNQAKGVIVAMHNRLHRMEIRLQQPSDVDALPDEFFDKCIWSGKAEMIRAYFLRESEAARQRRGVFLRFGQ